MSRKVIVLFLIYLQSQSTVSQLVEASFRSAGIVSDVIDRAPSDLLEVTYPNATVSLGNELTPTQVRNQPLVYWPVRNDTRSTYYTLIMVDPDAYSRMNPTQREVKHWLVGNILGNDISTGETIAEYLGSAPPNGSDYHRYVFLLYQQQSPVIYTREPRSSNTTLQNRPNFKTRNFATQYNLGHPVAGNFYNAQYDETVDELQRELDPALRTTSTPPIPANCINFNTLGFLNFWNGNNIVCV